MANTETYSFDARVVQLPGIACLGQALLDLILLPLKSWIRGKDTGCVSVISPTWNGYLWVTNGDEFYQDLDKFVETNKKTPNEYGPRVCRGAQFDVMPSGYVLKTYKYMPGSMRYGGFDKYALK